MLVLFIVALVCILFVCCYCYYCHCGLLHYKSILYGTFDKEYCDLLLYAQQKARKVRAAKKLDFTEIDFVNGGGGFNSLASVGACLLFKEIGLQIKRYSGTSAGAQSNFFMMGSPERVCEGVNWCLAVATTLRRYPIMRPKPMWDFLKTTAHKVPIPPPGKMHCTVTEFPTWYKPWVYSSRRVQEYKSHGDVADTILATASIPWYFLNNVYCKYRGTHVLDGGITDDIPVFRDNLRRQVVCYYKQDDVLIGFSKKAGPFGVYMDPDTMLKVMKHGVDMAANLIIKPDTSQSCLQMRT